MNHCYTWWEITDHKNLKITLQKIFTTPMCLESIDYRNTGSATLYNVNGNIIKFSS